MGIVLELNAAAVRRPRQAEPKPPVEARGVEPERCRSAASDAPLDCLAGGALASRFRSWRGLSGGRYICSVIPARRGVRLGGLPDFDSAVVIGVARNAKGERRRIAVFELCWRDWLLGEPERVATALDAGVCEWHVHLLAANARARRAAVADLAHG